MSYTALYRKWRPRRFSDVCGQDPIVTTLKNEIKLDRIGHAYLFCGTRGTGKTSVAKIFARAVNCEHCEDGEPCGECPACRGIADGGSVNMVEIDAASNNGVDNIREIRDEVQYRPATGRYRVYIIDEAHMLSAGAFNALLKTLEEPPEYVIFILATTESHKIPITVLSRCQRYDFRRIPVDVLAGRLRQICAAENISIEEKALRFIAMKGDGSMRDSISLLDECVAFHIGETLTYEMALEVLGTADNEVFSSLLRGILDGDTTSCLLQVEKAVMDGRDLSQFTQDFVWYLRNLLLLKTSLTGNELMELTREDWERYREEGERVSPEELIRLIRIFSALQNQLRASSSKRVAVDVAVIRATKPEMAADMDTVLSRLDELERRADEGWPRGGGDAFLRDFHADAGYYPDEADDLQDAADIPPAGSDFDQDFPFAPENAQNRPQNASDAQPEGRFASPRASVASRAPSRNTGLPEGVLASPHAAASSQEKRVITLPKAQAEDIMRLREGWKTIIDSFRGDPSVRIYLRRSWIEPHGEGSAYVVFSDDLSGNYIRGCLQKEGDRLSEAASKLLDKEIRLEVRVDKGASGETQVVSDGELSDIFHDIDVQVED